MSNDNTLIAGNTALGADKVQANDNPIAKSATSESAIQEQHSIHQPSKGSSELDENGYPEQRHAGKVGLGPNYHAGPSFDEKVSGVKEIIKGKITRNPVLVEHGREMKSGELKKKIEAEKEAKENPLNKGETGHETSKRIAEGENAEKVFREHEKGQDVARPTGDKIV